MREEQPTYIAQEGSEIQAIIVAEPIEIWEGDGFDTGESEIQDIIFKEGLSEDYAIAEKLMTHVINFYKDNDAKQVHVWCERRLFESDNLNLKCKVAIQEFEFKFLGFERVSKWSGLEIIKLELVF